MMLFAIGNFYSAKFYCTFRIRSQSQPDEDARREWGTPIHSAKIEKQFAFYNHVQVHCIYILHFSYFLFWTITPLKVKHPLSIWWTLAISDIFTDENFYYLILIPDGELSFASTQQRLLSLAQNNITINISNIIIITHSGTHALMYSTSIHYSARTALHHQHDTRMYEWCSSPLPIRAVLLHIAFLSRIVTEY